MNIKHLATKLISFIALVSATATNYAIAESSDSASIEVFRNYRENGLSIRVKPKTTQKRKLIVFQDPDFEFTGKHSVADHANLLVWQKSDNDKMYSWSDAINYCKSLDLDDREWRLPNRAELLSLVDFSRTKPAIDTSFFPETKSFNYWASTPYTGTPEHAWSILFSEGNAYCFLRELKNYARCVSNYE